MTQRDDDTQATPTGTEGEDAEGYAVRKPRVDTSGTEGEDTEGYMPRISSRTEDAPASTERDDAEGEASSGEGEDTEGYGFRGY